MSAESRELTEPECDRDFASLRLGVRRSRSASRGQSQGAGSQGGEGQGPQGQGPRVLEDISSEQLQQELNTIIANYQQEKERRRQSGGQNTFVISV